MFKQWLHDEEGQALAEYGLLIAVIAIAVIATLVIFRNRLAGTFQRAGEALTNSSTNQSAVPQ